MAQPPQSWRVPTQHYTRHPGQWAYLEFQAWAEDAERKGHFKSGQAKFIIEMFDNASKTTSPRDSLKGKLNECVTKRLITDGNRIRIQQKAVEILHQKSLQRIQQLAQEFGFVWFYKAPENTTTACFGNFFEAPGRVLGCKTAEGAFQAQKFVGNPFPLFAELNGDEAWRLGRSHPAAQKANWHQDGKEQAMRHVLADKFSPRSPLAATLLATGNAFLVEHNPVKGRDTFWSDDSDGSGQNMLGRLLMEQRHVLGGTGIVTAPPAYTNNARTLH